MENFERLATSGVSTPFGLIVLIRLWLGVGFSSSRTSSYRHAAS